MITGALEKLGFDMADPRTAQKKFVRPAKFLLPLQINVLSTLINI